MLKASTYDLEYLPKVGTHFYVEDEIINPGETARAYIKFVTPDAYPGCLWVGRIIHIFEGGRRVGEVKIIRIMNDLLLRTN